MMAAAVISVIASAAIWHAATSGKLMHWASHTLSYGRVLLYITDVLVESGRLQDLFVSRLDD